MNFAFGKVPIHYKSNLKVEKPVQTVDVEGV